MWPNLCLEPEINTMCRVWQAKHNRPALVTLPRCRHSGMNAAFRTLFNGSDGIHPAYAAYFGSPPPFQPAPLDPGSFPSTCANCRVPLSRQVGDWCVICWRLVNHQSMGPLESVGAWLDGMVFGPERLAWGWHDNCAVAVGSKCGFSLKRRPHGTVPEHVTVDPRLSHR